MRTWIFHEKLSRAHVKLSCEHVESFQLSLPFHLGAPYIVLKPGWNVGLSENMSSSIQRTVSLKQPIRKITVILELIYMHVDVPWRCHVLRSLCRKFTVGNRSYTVWLPNAQNCCTIQSHPASVAGFYTQTLVYSVHLCTAGHTYIHTRQNPPLSCPTYERLITDVILNLCATGCFQNTEEQT